MSYYLYIPDARFLLWFILALAKFLYTFFFNTLGKNCCFFHLATYLGRKKPSCFFGNSFVFYKQKLQQFLVGYLIIFYLCGF